MQAFKEYKNYVDIDGIYYIYRLLNVRVVHVVTHCNNDQKYVTNESGADLRWSAELLFDHRRGV